MWIIVLSVGSLFTVITTLLMCLCWKKKVQKNELLGLHGMVTQKNPDENVNHLPSANSQNVLSNSNAGDYSTINKRAVIVPKRSLPDIPSEGIRPDGDGIWDPNGDNSSDIYATVDPYPNLINQLSIPNGIEARPSISQHSSISQADDPYTKVDHPYDRLKNCKHDYARVQANSSTEQEENSSEEATPRTSLLCRTVVHQPLGEVVIASTSRRASLQSTAAIDILAASAVAGSVAASQELPYMTPPIAQTNFSGDSQDSSKGGYTSISVREPLANIRAQIKETDKSQKYPDKHYSTVSDDSDDVYTTIQDPNNLEYTSGSETYAQIQPTALIVEVEVNAIPSSATSSDSDNAENTPHQASMQPSVSSSSNKPALEGHSRQASLTSSFGNLGSPKPEKRQANSPLPPPPNVSPDLREKLPLNKNIDDMYAKVNKNKKKIDKEEQHLLQDSVPAIEKQTKTHNCPSASTPQAEPQEIVNIRPLHREHNYETLEKVRISPNIYGYDTVHGPDSLISSDPGYEVLKQNALSEIDPNYEELHRTSSISDSAAGYSTIKSNSSKNSKDNHSSDQKQPRIDPGYEELKSRNSSSYDSDPKDNSLDEPNYESMPSESVSEHNYAVLKSTGSESDPNYESVKYLDVSLDEPPYERLHDEDSGATDCDKTGYEKIKTGNSDTATSSAKDDTDYETVHNDTIRTVLEEDAIVQV